MASDLMLCGALVLASSSVVLSGCGDDEKEQVVDVAEACSRLEKLADALLTVQSATTPQQVRTAIDEPLAAFIVAADQSGDQRLADLAHTYDSRFSTYLTAEGIDAREAGNDADVALDRAGERCTELGATNDFPQES